MKSLFAIACFVCCIANFFATTCVENVFVHNNQTTDFLSSNLVKNIAATAGYFPELAQFPEVQDAFYGIAKSVDVGLLGERMVNMANAWDSVHGNAQDASLSSGRWSHRLLTPIREMLNDPKLAFYLAFTIYVACHIAGEMSHVVNDFGRQYSLLRNFPLNAIFARFMALNLALLNGLIAFQPLIAYGGERLLGIDANITHALTHSAYMVGMYMPFALKALRNIAQQDFLPQATFATTLAASLYDPAFKYVVTVSLFAFQIALLLKQCVIQ